MPENVKIVVADDSALYRALVRDTLAEKGHEVIVAANAREAVDLVFQHRPAVLVTDWEMPDMNGIELSKIIRQEAAFLCTSSC